MLGIACAAFFVSIVESKLCHLTKHNTFCYVLYIMQSIDILTQAVERCADKDNCLFSTADFSSLFPDFTKENMRMLLSRVAKRGLLERVCNGIYLFPQVSYDSSVILFKTACKLRARFFNYVSFETVLSRSGIISQLPLAWITVMTNGRKGIINCGRFGSVEFIHTEKKQENIAAELHFDTQSGMLWASDALALQDMKDAKRPFGLVDTSFRA